MVKLEMNLRRLLVYQSKKKKSGLTGYQLVANKVLVCQLGLIHGHRCACEALRILQVWGEKIVLRKSHGGQERLLCISATPAEADNQVDGKDKGGRRTSLWKRT